MKRVANPKAERDVSFCLDQSFEGGIVAKLTNEEELEVPAVIKSRVLGVQSSFPLPNSKSKVEAEKREK